MNAIALLRTSTDDQTLGLSAQRAAIEAYALATGTTIVSWHSEHISGNADLQDRPGLLAALSECLSTSSHLLISCRDRLSRDPMVALVVERQLKPHYLQVLAADGNNGDDATSVMIRSILDAVAAYERKLISARTKAALAALKASGVTLGRPRKRVQPSVT